MRGRFTRILTAIGSRRRISGDVAQVSCAGVPPRGSPTCPPRRSAPHHREGRPDALTMREIARGAGVSQAAPYPSLQGQGRHPRCGGGGGFREALRFDWWTAAPPRVAVPPSAYARSVSATFGSPCATPRTTGWCFSTPLAEPRPPSLQQAGQRAFGALFETVVEGQQAGVLRPGNPAQLAILSWAMVHGLAQLYNAGTPRQAGRLGGDNRRARGGGWETPRQGPRSVIRGSADEGADVPLTLVCAPPRPRPSIPHRSARRARGSAPRSTR